MARYNCRICKRKFSSPNGFTQHANAVHRGIKTLSIQQRSQQFQQFQTIEHNSNLWSMPIVASRTIEHTQQRSQQFQQFQTIEHDSNLWSMPITVIIEKPPFLTTSPEISALESKETWLDMESAQTSKAGEPLDEDKLQYNLRSRTMEIEPPAAIIDEDSEQSSEESLIGIQDITLDPEDLQGATLENALETLEGANKPERLAEWPSDAYRDFMELVVEGNISNKIRDRIIKFFNKHSNLEELPLPKSTKSGKDYLNQIQSPSVDFKEKVIATYAGVEFTLHYRPIFRAIQTLLQRPGITDNFVLRGVLRKEKVGLNFFNASRKCL